MVIFHFECVATATVRSYNLEQPLRMSLPHTVAQLYLWTTFCIVIYSACDNTNFVMLSLQQYSVSSRTREIKLGPQDYIDLGTEDFDELFDQAAEFAESYSNGECAPEAEQEIIVEVDPYLPDDLYRHGDYMGEPDSESEYSDDRNSGS